MEHPENDDQYTGLKVNKGIADVPTVNPYIKKRAQRKVYTPSEFVEGILKGNITILSQAVTLVESSKHEHQQVAQEIIEKCLPFAGKSVRIGITGVPGAGKSTSIDSFGMHLINLGRKLVSYTYLDLFRVPNYRVISFRTSMQAMPVIILRKLILRSVQRKLTIRDTVAITSDQTTIVISRKKMCIRDRVISVRRSSIERIKSNLGNIIAVGTTSVRTLESLYYMGCLLYTSYFSILRIPSRSINNRLRHIYRLRIGHNGYLR